MTMPIGKKYLLLLVIRSLSLVQESKNWYVSNRLCLNEGLQHIYRLRTA
jgi:hypothetical protein